MPRRDYILITSTKTIQPGSFQFAFCVCGQDSASSLPKSQASIVGIVTYIIQVTTALIQCINPGTKELMKSSLVLKRSFDSYIFLDHFIKPPMAKGEYVFYKIPPPPTNSPYSERTLNLALTRLNQSFF